MSKTKSRRKPTSFLQKTYEMANDPTNSHSIAWTPDGFGFAIKSVADFTERVLPKYFKHSNFASFVRQLNMYDFHKTREEDSDNVFRHPFFIKGRRHLLKEIHRKTSEFHPPSSPDMSPADCLILLEKLQTLQHQHELLEQTVVALRGENRDMVVHNKDLLAELDGYKQREEKLESLLHAFSGQLRSAQETVLHLACEGSAGNFFEEDQDVYREDVSRSKSAADQAMEAEFDQLLTKEYSKQ